MYQRYPEGMNTSNVGSGYDPDSTCTSYIQYSDDEGETWSTPEDITQQVKTNENIPFVFSGPGIGIQLRRGDKQGRIIMPFAQGPLEEMKVYTVYSDDGGETWFHGSVAENTYLSSGNEVQMVELSDGAIYLNSRSGINGQSYRNISYSFDSGETWLPLQLDSTLIDPLCMGSLIRYSDILDDGVSKLLFCNPASQISRTDGTIYQSLDDGNSWENKWLIEPGGFQYSSIVKIQESVLGILYETTNPWRIKYISVDVPSYIDSANIELIFPSSMDSIDIFDNELSWTIQDDINYEQFIVYHGKDIDNIKLSYSMETTILIDTTNLEKDSSYSWKVIAYDSSGVVVGNSNFQKYTVINNNLSITNLYYDKNLLNTYPNPFNSRITILINLYSNSNVSVSIYNLLGREIKQVANNYFISGQYKFFWDGLNESGKSMPSGVYLCDVNINGFNQTSRIILLK